MNLTQDQIKLLILNKIIPENCPPAQIDFFGTVCDKKKLDPMLKQIHLVERKSKDNFGKWVSSYTIQAGIDGMRVIAQRNCKIKSYRRWVEIREDDMYGICEIDTEDRGKYYDELPFKEYVQTKADGTPNTFWNRFKQTMIKKCAEESVLRMMAPEDLSGVYGDDEMQQADSETKETKQIAIQEAIKTIDKELEVISDPILDKINSTKTIKELNEIWTSLSEAQQPEYIEKFSIRKSIIKANVKK